MLVEKLGQRGRLQKALIAAFASSTSYDDTRKKFDRMAKVVTTLSDDEVEQVQKAYSANEWLHDAWYLSNRPYTRLVGFMKRCTGKEFAIVDGKLIIQKMAIGKKTPEDDEIPF